MSNETFWASKFAHLKEHGFGKTLKDHLITGWKDAKGKTAMRSGGVLLGAVIAGDALLRSESEGIDGRPESRSALGRLVEAVLGLGLAGSAALVGR